ncbi:FeoB-associated Cys-rich membrane protein [Enterococcus lemanii]|jgi:hypothetical protein|uniref:FeoB-associated Cys-rich membrane protein n=1 Tax=Enterococcus lemanii TaxID=1159752 RepID=A0ABV9MX84_9ENTE|nr:FeoB-associated Cys-rich membrane protein [Enterococcus lemanii]MBM7708104.1 hypothetical protein [Enterococcus lemanii]NLM65953.1 FeoB-associated Cys-rich membrane protein [Enterococcus sp.]
MATYILAVLIFGSAGRIIYRKISGKSSDCGACNVSCPAKKEQKNE